MISHRLWQRRWNGDPGVIGKEIVLNNHPFTIIGVAAEDFRGYQLPTAHSVWVPLHMAPQIQGSGDDRFLGTLLACGVPARRASKVDPIVALRYE